MTDKHPRFVEDLSRHNANLDVHCDACGNSGLFDPQNVASYFRAQRWSTLWEMVPRRFRCSKCGSKKITLKVEFKPPPLPRIDKPALLPRDRKPAPR